MEKIDRDAILDRIINRESLGNDGNYRCQEKVFRENKEIIKLQVAQDTASGEQKEKLPDVQGEHERLQQNMPPLQQGEELSSQDQEKLHRRPETLNEVKFTHKLGDELDKLVQQSREGVAAIHAAIKDAVRGLQQQQQQEDSRRLVVAQTQTRIKELVDELKGMNESEVLMQAACCDLDELAAAIENAKRHYTQANIEFDKRDDAIKNVKRNLDSMRTILEEDSE